MSATPGLALFDTAIGRCGIAWSARGVAGVCLPDGGVARMRAVLRGRLPGAADCAPPPVVRAAIDGIDALLRGEAVDLAPVVLDMDGIAPFDRRVYEAARDVPAGATITYGELARRIGAPGAARAVGRALGRNPFAVVVPCHRVLAAGGRTGGFSAAGGVATKLRLLAIERAHGAGGLFGGEAIPAFDVEAAVTHLRNADPRLARLIEAVGPLRLRVRHTASLFAALAEAIVYQQLAGRAAAAIHARFCALFPYAHLGPTPERLLRLSDAALRGAGLSAAKIAALRDLARRTRAGELPALAEAQTTDDETIIERLTRVRGVGRWTAQMLLIFRLGRPDVLPVDDYGIRKGFAVTVGGRDLPGARELERHAERWRPYRSAACWYLWRAAERGGI